MTTVRPIKLTTKGRVEKDYQTPHGVATVARHVYQSPQRGPTYCPLDRDARNVVPSTPRFAKIISHKYAEFSSPWVRVDLEENHGRVVSRCLIHDVADAVAAAALAKQEDWSYALPKFEEPPATVAISLDGTCTLMCEDGWREATVGTLAFYDREGELHQVEQGEVHWRAARFSRVTPSTEPTNQSSVNRPSTSSTYSPLDLLNQYFLTLDRAQSS